MVVEAKTAPIGSYLIRVMMGQLAKQTWIKDMSIRTASIAVLAS